MAPRKRAGIDPEFKRIERTLLEDIRYCDRVLLRDTLDTADIAGYKAMRKSNLEKLIEKKHPNKIFYSDKQDLFYTQDPDNMRRKLRAKTKEKLLDKLYLKYYGEQTYTVAQIFPLWLEWYKATKGVTDLTALRHEQVFRKRLDGTKIAEMKIVDVTASDIQSYFAGFAEKLTRHQLNDIKTILNGIFDYAIIRGIVQINMSRTCNTTYIKTVAANDDPYNTYTDEDRSKLLEVLEESDDVYDLAIMLMFCLCCSIGEIRALHFEDIDFSAY